jgi:hypothetical protein
MKKSFSQIHFLKTYQATEDGSEPVKAGKDRGGLPLPGACRRLFTFFAQKKGATHALLRETIKA